MTTVKTFFKAYKRPKAPKISPASKRPGMDPEHLANIRRLNSCLSSSWPTEAHHLRCCGGRGVGLRAEDRWCVPLTAEEHRGPHGVHSVPGNAEFKWFLQRGLNCIELAQALWNARNDINKMQLIVTTHRENAKRYVL